MLVAHYLPRVATALFGGLFVFAGLYSFGDGLLFDRLFIGVIILTAVVCRKDINVMGILVILVIQRLLEETAWSISELDFKHIVKPAFYLAAILVFWKIKYDGVAKFLLATLLIAIAAEFYWLATKVSAPEVYWYVGLLTSNVFIRHLIFMRVSYSADIFPTQAESINLDWHIYKLNGLAAFFQFAIVVEYAFRTVLNNLDIIYIYKIYPYCMQLIATYAIWMVFYESYRMLVPKLLKV